MYSVDSEEEAKALLSRACPRNVEGEFIAEELEDEQDLDRLAEFSDRLDRIYTEEMGSE